MKTILVCGLLFFQLSCTCKCEPVQGNDFGVNITDNVGNNLIYGPASRFKKDSLRILNAPTATAQKAGDIEFRNDSSSLQFYLYSHPFKTYVYYGSNYALDTLDLEWQPRTGKCCGERYTSYRLTALRLNGISITPQNAVFTFRK